MNECLSLEDEDLIGQRRNREINNKVSTLMVTDDEQPHAF